MEESQLNQTEVYFNITIGEINGIFGAINTSSFQAVARPLAEKANEQIVSAKIPTQQTQQEVLNTPVSLAFTVEEINTIFSIVNSTNFATILKPVLDNITNQVQLFVSALNQQSTAPIPSNNEGSMSLPPLPPYPSPIVGQQ